MNLSKKKISGFLFLVELGTHAVGVVNFSSSNLTLKGRRSCNLALERHHLTKATEPDHKLTVHVLVQYNLQQTQLRYHHALRNNADPISRK